jgi:hypothetical protein
MEFVATVKKKSRSIILKNYLAHHIAPDVSERGYLLKVIIIKISVIY